MQERCLDLEEVLGFRRGAWHPGELLAMLEEVLAMLEEVLAM